MYRTREDHLRELSDQEEGESQQRWIGTTKNIWAWMNGGGVWSRLKELPARTDLQGGLVYSISQCYSSPAVSSMDGEQTRA